MTNGTDIQRDPTAIERMLRRQIRWWLIWPLWCLGVTFVAKSHIAMAVRWLAGF